MVKVILANPPEGYEAEAEYRYTKCYGEACLNQHGESEFAYSKGLLRIVLTPQKTWRQPRFPEDWGKPCRVRNFGDENWADASLRGYRPFCKKAWVTDVDAWIYCEVEDT